ncbi:hypothetical protein KR032_005623 [Drosophila birchii]|nr:hypothetical protein KR032_005623 [Drosophila birchii]
MRHINRQKLELYSIYEKALSEIDKNPLNFSTFDIVQKIIEANVTELYPSQCPPQASAHGIFTVQVTGLDPFQVSCDAKIAGSGWTVIARRTSNKLNFFRNWAEYKNGFGNITEDFFIGLDKLHSITKAQPHDLYIHLEDFEGKTRYAHYDDFFIESENLMYAMTKLGTFTGDAGDSLIHNKNQNFSTFDRDNDAWEKNCAIEYMGAWWYINCTYSNLFGLYLHGEEGEFMKWKGMVWPSWREESYSYKTMQMMVRPKCLCSIRN